MYLFELYDFVVYIFHCNKTLFQHQHKPNLLFLKDSMIFPNDCFNVINDGVLNVSLYSLFLSLHVLLTAKGDLVTSWWSEMGPFFRGPPESDEGWRKWRQGWVDGWCVCHTLLPFNVLDRNRYRRSIVVIGVGVVVLIVADVVIVEVSLLVHYQFHYYACQRILEKKGLNILMTFIIILIYFQQIIQEYHDLS